MFLNLFGIIVTFDNFPILPRVTTFYRAAISLVKYKPRQNLKSLSPPPYFQALYVCKTSRKQRSFSADYLGAT